MQNIRRIAGLAAAYAASLNGTMVMPLIVLALNRIPGIDEGSATAIGAAELGGIALYSLLAPGLVRRARRLTTIAGLLALVVGEAATNYLDGVAPLFAARALAGLGEGALFSLITADVASEANAERIWGQINLVGGVAMGCLLYGLSTLPANAERGSLFLWLAAMGLFVAPWILAVRPRAPLDADGAVLQPALKPGQIGRLLAVVLLAYGVQAGQWAVSGFMGEQAHLAPARIGLFLALSSIGGFAGAIVPSLSRNPAHRLPFMLLGFGLMAAALLAFFNWPGATPFLWGQIGVNVGFYMVTPFISGQLTQSDRDGSLVLRTLLVALFGAAAGTALAGELFARAGATAFSIVCLATVAVAMAVTAKVFAHAHCTAKGTLEETQCSLQVRA